MKRYVFKHNQDKINEKIVLVKNNDGNIEEQEIGTIYNLVDFINNTHFENNELAFVNFTGDKMNFIISSITRYKNIVTVNDYNIIIVSDKKIKIKRQNLWQNGLPSSKRQYTKMVLI